ncbi:hypothetical protein HNV12_19180 [Methanococcoides sp. SA1]|nr:hypothetical protein [Methanococcoides sp. SA1]
MVLVIHGSGFGAVGEVYGELVFNTAMQDNGLDVESIPKIGEGRPNIIDRIISGNIDLVVNTICGRKSTLDDILIRLTAIESNIPYITTISGFKAATKAVVKTANHSFGVKPLQEYKVI